MTQPALPGLAKLSSRQQLALTYIRAEGPVSNQQVGQHVREARGARGQDWDISNGRRVCEALKRQGLIRRTRAGWVDKDWRPPRAEPFYGEIPF